MTSTLLPARRVHALTEPPIPEAHGWAAEYRRQCGPMLDMCQAVPGYPPHPDLLGRLASEASRRDNARYGLINGDLALREAYAADMSATYGGTIGPEEVTVTAGCNQAFFLAMLTLLAPGDAVLLPTPWFWNHEMSCRMLGVEPHPLPCAAADGFVPDPEVAESLLDKRTRAVVLITPNNPTGAVYPPDTIARFLDLAQRRGLWLILDETYRDFLPTGQGRAHGCFTEPGWPGHLVQLYSFSKAFCIPGGRLGALTASAALTPDFVKALDCLHICPQRPVQAAVAWAIDALRGWRAENRAEINRRGRAMHAALDRAPGWSLASLGAYFAYVRHPFADVPGHDVAARLARERGILALPGSAFGPGQEQFIRIAFANATTDEIAQLPERLAF